LLVGALLSACGLGLLVLDTQSGIGGWDNVFWQVTGVVAGVSCFVTIVRRAWLSDHAFVGARVVVLPATVVVRPWDAPSFGLDRPLFVEVVRFAVNRQARPVYLSANRQTGGE